VAAAISTCAAIGAIQSARCPRVIAGRSATAGGFSVLAGVRRASVSYWFGTPAGEPL
jgi:hypothetical protein